MAFESNARKWKENKYRKTQEEKCDAMKFNI